MLHPAFPPLATVVLAVAFDQEVSVNQVIDQGVELVQEGVAGGIFFALDPFGGPAQVMHVAVDGVELRGQVGARASADVLGNDPAIDPVRTAIVATAIPGHESESIV